MAVIAGIFTKIIRTASLRYRPRYSTCLDEHKKARYEKNVQILYIYTKVTCTPKPNIYSIQKMVTVTILKSKYTPVSPKLHKVNGYGKKQVIRYNGSMMYNQIALEPVQCVLHVKANIQYTEYVLCTPSTTSQKNVERSRCRNVCCTGGNASITLICICGIWCILELLNCNKWRFGNDWLDGGEEKSMVTINRFDMVSVHCKMETSNQEMAMPAMEMEGQQQGEQTGELLKYIVITSVKCALLMPLNRSRLIVSVDIELLLCAVYSYSVLLCPLNRSRPIVFVDIELLLCAVYSYSYIYDTAVYHRLSERNPNIKPAYVKFSLGSVILCWIVVDANHILKYPRKYLYCIKGKVIECEPGSNVRKSSQRCSLSREHITNVWYYKYMRIMSILKISVYKGRYINTGVEHDRKEYSIKCGGNWRISYRE
jgi:hypothetical protein